MRQSGSWCSEHENVYRASLCALVEGPSIVRDRRLSSADPDTGDGFQVERAKNNEYHSLFRSPFSVLYFGQIIVLHRLCRGFILNASSICPFPSSIMSEL